MGKEPLFPHVTKGSKSVKTFTPPVCPNCGKPILRVKENVYETWSFDSKSGTYEDNPAFDTMDIKCSECDYDLSGVFPSGACNYESKR
jgi:hypothetical protein